MSEAIQTSNNTSTANYYSQNPSQIDPNLLANFEANEVLQESISNKAIKLQSTKDNIFDQNSTSELFRNYSNKLSKISETLKTQTNLQPDLYLAGTFTDFGSIKSVNVALVNTDSGLPQATVPALFSANVMPSISPVADVKVFRLSDNSFEPGFSVPSLANQITLTAQNSAKALGMPNSIADNLIGFANIRYNFTSGKVSLNTGLFVKAVKSDATNNDNLQSNSQKKIIANEMLKNNGDNIAKAIFGDNATTVANTIDTITDFAKTNPASLGIKKAAKYITTGIIENKAVNFITKNTVGIVGIGERNLEVKINFKEGADQATIMKSLGIDENTTAKDLNINTEENIKNLANLQKEFEKTNQSDEKESTAKADWEQYNEFASTPMSKEQFNSRTSFLAVEKLGWVD